MSQKSSWNSRTSSTNPFETPASAPARSASSTNPFATAHRTRDAPDSNDSYSSHRHRSPSSSQGHRYAASTSTSGSRYAHHYEEGPSSQALLDESKRVRQETLDVAKESLRRLRQTEETAEGTMSKLETQSEHLHRAKQSLHHAQAHERIAADQVTELGRLNKLFGFKNPFRNRRKEKAMIESRDQDRARQAMRERDETQASLSATKQRMQASKLQSAQQQRTGFGSIKIESDLLDEEDRKQEQELDETLDDIGSALGNLKMMAMTMNSEVQHQNVIIGDLSSSTDDFNARMKLTQGRMQKFGK